MLDRLPRRFRSKIRVDGRTDCWEWTAAKTGGPRHGYGNYNTGKDRLPWQTRFMGAHKYAYEWLHGKVPDDLELDHLCRRPACVNPEHLEAVTRGENIRRGVAPEIARAIKAAITHCPQGHEYAGENLYITPAGHRQCRICRLELQRRQRRARGIPVGNKYRTHCPAGHEYAGVNLHITRTGRRHCRACDRERHRAARRRKAA